MIDNFLRRTCLKNELIFSKFTPLTINLLSNLLIIKISIFYLQFNISLQDLKDIADETKRAFESATGEKSNLINLPLNVEISLKTEEGYDMLLEVWTLTIAPESNSPTIRSSHHVYNSFGVLLKSVICVSRATPAYKLSRRQKTESYKIDHTISAGKLLDLNRLGK